jgi:uncharacterized protein involved in exopolysaccharide biosynthesis
VDPLSLSTVEQLNLNTFDGHRRSHPPVLRELVAIGFRQRRLIVVCFCGVLLGAIIVAILQPDRYTSEMKIMVKRERVDPIVTPEATVGPQFASEVTEAELNSEVELLKTRDLLEKVVRECGLHDQGNSAWSKISAMFGSHTASERTPRTDAQVPRAVNSLQKKLSVEVMKKTNLILVSYESSDPVFSARVLTILADLYLQKHLDVHRPSGALDFFHQETERYRKGLAEAHARLVEFNRNANVISSQFEKEAALQKLTEFQANGRQTEGAIAEIQQHISILEKQLTTTPIRMVTQVRRMDDASLLSQLRANLVTLELKRTELLQKFAPTYRPVQGLEVQIAQIRAALAEADSSQLHEETTDSDPLYLALNTEMVKAKADLAGLQARAEATARSAEMYRENARSLESKEIAQSDLLRTVKAEEERYLLYLRKEDEARISDALDRRRIINVAVAEAATVPAFPSNRRALTLFVGLLLAVLLSFGMGWICEFLDPTFRTPDEVRAFLNVTVLAALPANGEKNADTNVSSLLSP